MPSNTGAWNSLVVDCFPQSRRERVKQTRECSSGPTTPRVARGVDALDLFRMTWFAPSSRPPAHVRQVRPHPFVAFPATRTSY